MSQAGASQPPAPAATWAQAERGQPGLGRELARVLRRARARKGRTLVCALLVALALVAIGARRQPAYQARLVLRVSESATAAGGSQLIPPQDLRAYIEEVAFSRAHLARIMAAHDLYPGLRDRDPQAAHARMRDDLSVTVGQNYFLDYRRRGEGPRSVRVLIGYRAGSPALAQAVVGELAGLFEKVLAEELRAVTSEAVEVAHQAVLVARDRVQRGQRELAAARAAHLGRAPDARAGVSIARLEASLAASTAELAEIERREQELTLARDMEQSRLGLRFQVGQVRQPLPREPGLARLLRFGLIGLVLGLPLCAIAVGAADRRVYDEGDVARLGLATVGRVRIG